MRGVGALAALLLGAGAWSYFYAQSFAGDPELARVPSYLIAAGAVVLGIVIWIGTSSEPPVRVGDPGISVEKGELRRMPWWAVDAITFDSASKALVVAGKDDAGVEWTFRVPRAAHAEALGWILQEALDRVPRRVDIPEATLAQIPAAGAHAGLELELDPLQVVGKRDAGTGKIISYEPDARVCPRCERVYHQQSVPKKCRCGASLAHLMPKGGASDAAGASDGGGDGDDGANAVKDDATPDSVET